MPSARRKKIQPDALPRRVVSGHVLSSHVVAVEGRWLIFVARRLASDRSGNIVGVGDMRAQVRQVGENICAALAVGGATLNDLVEMTTFVSDIEGFFPPRGCPGGMLRPRAAHEHHRRDPAAFPSGLPRGG